MSVEASSWAWKQKLKPGAKLVLLCLADHANAEGLCWPGQDGISNKTGLDRSTVVGHLGKLEESGLIEARRRYDEHGYKKSNLYILNLSKVLNSNVGNPNVGKSNVGKAYVGKSESYVGFSDAYVGKPNNTHRNIIEPSEEPSDVLVDSSLKAVKKSSEEYSSAFEDAWKSYPKREGNNPKKEAYKSWKARIREGHSEDELCAGVNRYAAYIRFKGKERTEFVQQATTFFGTKKSFLEDWDIQTSKEDSKEKQKEEQPWFMRGI